MRLKAKLISGLFCLMLVLSCSLPLFAQNEADLILYNGKIITVDPQDHIYQAAAVKDGKILQVGDDAEIKLLAGPRCKMIDLKGKTVTPGLIDSHYHMMYYGQQFWEGYLNIRHPDVSSKADLLRVVSEYAKQLTKDAWISGNQGFHLQSDEALDRFDLDPITPQNPVYLRHGSGQYSVVNSLALEIAGIDSLTPNPHSSRIIRDANGHATGVLSHYPAENLVAQHATGYGDRTEEQKIEDIERGQELCLQAGYTSIQDVIVGSYNDIMLYKKYAESGKLKVRLYTMLYINTEEQANYFAQSYQPIDTGRFTFGGWKLAMDGGFAAKTILMYDKSMYASNLSYPYFDQDEFNRIVTTLHNTGLQVAVHVGGDEGIDMVITAFEEAMKANPRPDPRHRIEHGLFPATAALQRMKDSKIILSTQPQWIAWHGDAYSETTNQQTMNLLLPLKTMLNMGIPIAFGCDVPASIYQEPKWAFHGAAFRRTSSGVFLQTQERLSMPEVLRIHTMGSAYAGFAENTTGSLEPGKYADLVIWSNDLYNVAPADLMNLESEMTIVNGEILFDAGKNPVTSYSNLWLATGNMNSLRQEHAAILLKNGKVLIAGWESKKGELYDPASGAFSETGSTVNYHRQGSTATLLNDGKVLIAGGVNAQKIAEIYNPETGLFSLTDSLKNVHCYHTATLLPDGRVLIAGGQDNNGPQTHAVAEIYDPQSGKFSLTGSLKVDRSSHTATLLPNGKVLITGGIHTTTPGSGNYLNSCEIYDPGNGTFILVKNMNQNRTGHSATLLADDKVLIIGGAWYSNIAELYDYATDSWSTSGSMNVIRRNNHTATLLPDGKVLVAGGFVEAATAKAEIFDPATSIFSVTDSMTTPRMQHRATRLMNGDVLITGGYDGKNTIKSAELFIVETTTAVRRDNPLMSHPEAPETFLLSQNYPNPFNPATTFNYRMPSAGRVRIAIYNLNGQLIRSLVDSEQLPGNYSATWDGKSDDGNAVVTGVYLVRMESGNQVASRKILYLK
jgi:predicted amidohydrolase YtcJ